MNDGYAVPVDELRAALTRDALELAHLIHKIELQYYTQQKIDSRDFARAFVLARALANIGV